MTVMRRRIRDALVGFSIVGAAIGFLGTQLWMKGVQMGSNTWNITARFSDATGLAKLSPVTYRGIVIGSVSRIKITPKAVLATLEINESDLKLPLPVTASIAKGSLLGGNAQVALISHGAFENTSSLPPVSEKCLPELILCEGSIVTGEAAGSLSNVAKTLDRILRQAEKKKLVNNIDSLILQFKEELERAIPIIENLKDATSHINNVVSALDNPKTIKELKDTVSTANSLTEKIDAVGEDIEALTADPKFMNAVRNVTIGLGEFFSELYPAQTALSND